MSGRRKWADLKAASNVDPEKVAEYRRAMERDLTLAELRRARELTQVQIATSLGMTQPGVSRIESQADLYLSTLRSYVEALGGQLDLVAVFPDGAVTIKTLDELAEPDAAGTGTAT
jgi:transcriptional regulator with XRE-family HTH domain